MRLVHIREGRLEIRWTWLPLWLAQNPRLKSEVERQLRDALLVNGMTTAERDLDALHRYAVKLIYRVFPIAGIDRFLDGLREIEAG